ncbi:hypothetical protein GCM10009060_09940 [Halorubrum trapanicum]
MCAEALSARLTTIAITPPAPPPATEYPSVPVSGTDPAAFAPTATGPPRYGNNRYTKTP